MRGRPAEGHLDRVGEAGALPHRAKEQRRRSRLGREGDTPPPHRARKEQGRCRRAAEVGKERGTGAGKATCARVGKAALLKIALRRHRFCVRLMELRKGN